MRSLHRRFNWHYIGQIYGGDFAKFCGLLRIYELYIIRFGQNNSFFPSKITDFGCYEFCSVTNLQIWRAGVHPTLHCVMCLYCSIISCFAAITIWYCCLICLDLILDSTLDELGCPSSYIQTKVNSRFEF